MKIIIDGQAIELPNEIIQSFFQSMSDGIAVKEEMADEVKQKVRKGRMTIKSLLIVIGGELRAFFGIREKPGKNEDIINWHLAAFGDVAVKVLRDKTIKVRTVKQDENAFIAEIYT